MTVGNGYSEIKISQMICGNKKWIDKILYFIIEYDTLLIFLIMVLISSIISDVFFTYANISNLLRQVSG